MSIFYQYLLTYLLISFALGSVWHIVLFKDYYKKLAIYSNIDNPRFLFGLTAMLLQGIVLAFIFPLISNPWIFGIGLFMILISFMVFAEAGKQKVTSLSGFVFIEIMYSAIQAVLITVSFLIISSLN